MLGRPRGKRVTCRLYKTYIHAHTHTHVQNNIHLNEKNVDSYIIFGVKENTMKYTYTCLCRVST